MTEAVGHAIVTCDALARDPSGKLTLYGLFDRILAERFPVVHPQFSIFWRCLVPGPGRVGVELLRPGGGVLAEFEPVETAKEGPHVVGAGLSINGQEFPVAGEYQIVLRYNGKEVMRSPMHLAEHTAK